MNLLNRLSEDECNIRVLTTSGFHANTRPFVVNHPGIKIHRLGISGLGLSSLRRWMNYLYFHFASLFYLFLHRPSKVLYFETLSSFPALLYKWVFSKKADLFIHYHEYTSPNEYKIGSKLLHFFNTIERKMYSHANWISHINEFRLQQFVNDYKNCSLSNIYVLPNYPPSSWNTTAMKQSVNFPIRLVYVGSIGLDLMHTEAFAHWVKKNNGSVVWDIYTNRINTKVGRFFNELSADNIHLKGCIDYFRLPEVLKNYDVGLILYKGDIPNHLYVTPNKLFEYHSCGLDVWFSDKIVSCMPLITNDTYPKIVAIDFEQLNQIDINMLTDRGDCQQFKKHFTYEEALKELINELKK